MSSWLCFRPLVSMWRQWNTRTWSSQSGMLGDNINYVHCGNIIISTLRWERGFILLNLPLCGSKVSTQYILKCSVISYIIVITVKSEFNVPGFSKSPYLTFFLLFLAEAQFILCGAGSIWPSRACTMIYSHFHWENEYLYFLSVLKVVNDIT